MHPAPGAVDSASRLRRRYADAPAAPMLTGGADVFIVARRYLSNMQSLAGKCTMPSFWSRQHLWFSLVLGIGASSAMAAGDAQAQQWPTEPNLAWDAGTHGNINPATHLYYSYDSGVQSLGPAVPTSAFSTLVTRIFGWQSSTRSRIPSCPNSVNNGTAIAPALIAPNIATYMSPVMGGGVRSMGRDAIAASESAATRSPATSAEPGRGSCHFKDYARSIALAPSTRLKLLRA
jgi:hypothetical protein